MADETLGKITSDLELAGRLLCHHVMRKVQRKLNSDEVVQGWWHSEVGLHERFGRINLLVERNDGACELWSISETVFVESYDVVLARYPETTKDE